MKVDQNLMHSIESVVIDWSSQIHEVLKKDSSQALLDGLNPDPFVEVEFWRSKYNNLLSIFEQVMIDLKTVLVLPIESKIKLIRLNS